MPAEINATISANPPVQRWASTQALGTVPRLAVAVLDPQSGVPAGVPSFALSNFALG